MRYKFVIITLFLFILVIRFPFLVHYERVAGQTSPPANGDWVISDTTTINDDTIFLNGNLVIQTSGTLNLNNCTLIMNCSAQTSYSITVEGNLFSGGEFNVEDTTIQSNDSNYPYNFSVELPATMNMRKCTVRDLGGQINLSNPVSSLGGIQIHSGNVLIEDSNITDYKTIGIMVMPYAAPTIKNCNISMNPAELSLTVGILDSSVGLVTPKYLNNYISGNLISGLLSVGVPMSSSFATISGNTFAINTAGVSCWGTDPDIQDNVFNLNALTGIALMDCDSEIWNNRISYSTSGISVLNPCTPDIHDNFINLSGTGLILYNGTDAKVHHNNISENLVFGVSTIGADPEIYYNDVYNNLVGGIYLDDSDATAHHNTISGLILSRGIIVRNDSAPNIYQNTIYCDDYGIGMELDGNRSLKPVIDGNTIHVGYNGTCMDMAGFASSIIDNEFYYGEGGNGINISSAEPELKRNKFISIQGAFGAYMRSAAVLLENNTFDGNNIGIYAHNCTPVTKQNDFSENDHFGILFDECANPKLEKNTFEGVNDNPVGEHVNVEMEVINSSNVLADLSKSYLRLLNSTYSAPTIASGSVMQVDWFLDIHVKRYDNSPAQGVAVNLFNCTGQLEYTFTTDADGRSIWNQVTEKYFISSGTEAVAVSHLPYNVKARLNKLMDNETVMLNISKTVTLILDYNYGPTGPANIMPESTHNRTPEIKWEPSFDPENDPISYHLSIGTTKGAGDIVYEYNTSLLYYLVQTPLEFRKYYITLSAHTPDLNSSAPLETVMNVFNDPPVMKYIEDIMIYLDDEEPQLRFFVNATDPNTDPMDTLTFSTNTTLFSIDPKSGEVNWTPDESVIGMHIVNFSVNDGYTIDFQTVNITIGYRNIAPVADAGDNITAYVGQDIILNGSGSYDTDGTIIEYLWTYDSLTVAELNISDPIRPWFRAEEISNYSYELRVRDNNGTWSAPDTVWVDVLAKKDEPKIPGLILSNPSVNPITGTENDNYVFNITLIGINVTPALIQQVEDTILVQLEIDGKTKVVVERIDDISNASDLYNGIQYSVEISGKILGVGNHTFRFFCNFDNISGELGVQNGPLVIANDVAKSHEEATGDGSIMAAIAAIIILAIIIIIIFIMFLRNRSGKTLVKHPPKNEPNAPGQITQRPGAPTATQYHAGKSFTPRESVSRSGQERFEPQLPDKEYIE